MINPINLGQSNNFQLTLDKLCNENVVFHNFMFFYFFYTWGVGDSCYSLSCSLIELFNEVKLDFSWINN